MDASTLMKLFLSSNSTDAFGKISGASSDQVASVLKIVMPMLLSGAGQQATGAETASSFAKAIDDHANADTKDLGSFLGGVDAKDGAKIIQHLLGGNTTSVIADAMKASGLTEKAVKTILIAAAPLLLSILGQQKKKHGINGSALLSAVLAGSMSNASSAGSLLGILGKIMK